MTLSYMLAISISDAFPHKARPTAAKSAPIKRGSVAKVSPSLKDEVPEWGAKRQRLQRF